MKLYIAEKPSLGRAIAAALSHSLAKPHKNHKTHIELANGDVVSWCVGHILAQADPEDYDDSLKMADGNITYSATAMATKAYYTH